MDLFHFSTEPVATIRPAVQALDLWKPVGLWVSDESHEEDSWTAWCRLNDFGEPSKQHAYRVTLATGHGLLVVDTADALDRVDREYSTERTYALDWPLMAERYSGILITPYQWSRRLAADWYYSWDCASGCIWDPSAIGSFDLVASADA